MLEFFSSGLVSLWFNAAGLPEPLHLVQTVFTQDAPWMALPGDPDPFAQATLQQYLKQLAAAGLVAEGQGVWLQSGPTVLASNQGTTPLPAASLTKVATTLVALQTWGPQHQFETLISATGPIQNGVLQGDLVVQGKGDPLFVWEEAIALGNQLNQMGITRVTGNLIVTGSFSMNFEPEPGKSGELLKQALNADAWSGDAEYQYQQMPKGTARPRVAIAGSVQVVNFGTALLPQQTLLLRHHSLPLSDILKLMNLYSNNVIAESLAGSLGGAQVMAQQASVIAGFPIQEIVLSNGSGLGVENRISPRAVCMMFAAVQRYLQPYNLTIADLFPISGTDLGTIDGRKIPTASVVKTGTLNDVSALAGVLPTRDRGLLWFTIINRGTDLDGLRAGQDRLLQALTSQWGVPASLPIAVTPTTDRRTLTAGQDATRRSEIVKTAVEVNTF